MAYEKQGKFKDAIAHMKKATQLDNDLGNTAFLAVVYAESGNKEEAKKILRKLLLSTQDRYVPSIDIALIHSALGENDESCQWLEKAYIARDSELADMKTDPHFSGPNAIPCFKEIKGHLGY